MKSTHPYEPFIPAGATKLIIGTIPPPRFCKDPQVLEQDDVNFYYGSKDNYFWEILSEVFKEELDYANTQKAIDQRKKLLEIQKVGITDIIAHCEHKKDSASDKDIEYPSHKDLKKLLEENPQINCLIYTSEFVKKQVNDYFKTYHSIESGDKKKQTLKILDKTYNVRILYSPSPQALRNLGPNGKEERLKQYKKFLLEN